MAKRKTAKRTTKTAGKRTSARGRKAAAAKRAGGRPAAAKTAKKAAKKSAKRSAKTSAKKSSKRGSQKRQTLKRGRKNVAFAKRRNDGTFKEIDDTGGSLSQDRRRDAEREVAPGYGDEGDQD